MGILGTRKRIDSSKKAICFTTEEILEDARKKGFVNNDCVDIERIILDNGILIKRTKLPSMVSGSLKKENGQWVIEVNAQHNIKRQRFTLAHELAHYFYHTDFQESFIDDEIFYRNEESNPMEFAANRFASDLLIDPKTIRKVIQNGMTNINELAEHFNVSSIALKIQLSNLGYRMK